ncbi:MAG: SurA N-terminal domain-containing protein [Candidatus Promineifilaceae bacterium]
MTKKRSQSAAEQERQSRKEVLRARRHQRQTRQIRLALVGVIALLVIVLAVGAVLEFVVQPRQPIAFVHGEEITMGEWQDRVGFQRAQLIIGIEQLAEAVGGDIGQVQQFAAQQINLLLDPAVLGQTVLDELIDQALVRQEAEARGITVTDADVQVEIEESFNFFNGESPTPAPTATETPIPTPSLTPIPTAVITELLPTATPLPSPTLGPTATPLPTPTPVSQEAFQEDFAAVIAQFEELGFGEANFREVIRAQLYQEQLADALAEEENLPSEAEQVSFWYLAFDSEEKAEEARQQAGGEGFQTVWNRIRSLPADAEGEEKGFASEFLWRTRENVEQILSEEAADAAFTLTPGVPSRVIPIEGSGEDAQTRYYVLQVSGREVRPLSESAIESEKRDLLNAWIESERATGVETFERWRGNEPRRPRLDARFLVAPTPAPATATPPFSLPTAAATPATPVASPEP